MTSYACTSAGHSFKKEKIKMEKAVVKVDMPRVMTRDVRKVPEMPPPKESILPPSLLPHTDGLNFGLYKPRTGFVRQGIRATTGSHLIGLKAGSFPGHE